MRSRWSVLSAFGIGYDITFSVDTCMLLGPAVCVLAGATPNRCACFGAVVYGVHFIIFGSSRSVDIFRRGLCQVLRDVFSGLLPLPAPGFHCVGERVRNSWRCLDDWCSVRSLRNRKFQCCTLIRNRMTLRAVGGWTMWLQFF